EVFFQVQYHDIVEQRFGIAVKLALPGFKLHDETAVARFNVKIPVGFGQITDTAKLDFSDFHAEGKITEVTQGVQFAMEFELGIFEYKTVEVETGGNLILAPVGIGEVGKSPCQFSHDEMHRG